MSTEQTVDAIEKAHHGATFIRNRCLLASKALGANMDDKSEEAERIRFGVLDMIEQMYEDLDELTSTLDAVTTSVGGELERAAG